MSEERKESAAGCFATAAIVMGGAALAGWAGLGALSLAGPGASYGLGGIPFAVCLVGILGGFLSLFPALIGAIVWWTDRRNREASGKAKARVVTGVVVSAIAAAANVLILGAMGPFGHGRPLRRRGVVVAELDADGSWGEAASLPEAEALAAPGLRERLAEAWLADGLAEHSSVATFSHLALELMREGAPPELVGGCQRAALEEVGHARTAFAWASRFAGRPLGPGEFPGVERPLPPAGRRARLRRLAERSLVDGCLGEELGARSMADSARICADPAMGAALARMAAEEHGHAEFAWEVLGGCLSELGDGDRESLARSLEAAPSGSAAGDPELRRWGRPDPAGEAAHRRRVLGDCRARLSGLAAGRASC